MNEHLLTTDETGQGLVEYSLILSMVSIAAVAALTVLGSSLLSLPGWNLF